MKTVDSTPEISSAPSSLQETFCVVPSANTAASTFDTSSALPSPPPHPAAITASRRTIADRLPFLRMRWSFRLALLASLVAITGVIMPVALSAAGSSSPGAGIPDEWSGEWPAQLMETTGATPLGTLVWREIRYEEGIALVGKNFGGKVFTGCPSDGRTRFFRGRYVQGGELIGCTRGDDGTELTGRFNGNETFRSSDFTIKLKGRSPSFFFGEYVEDDGGQTVDWCGTRTRVIAFPDTQAGTDYVAPTVRMRSATAKAGSLARLRFTVRDKSPTVRVDLIVISGKKALTNLTLPAARADGHIHTKTWRVPASARGKKLRVCAAALDRSGNMSGRSCAALTVT